jgi:hypothetical protein
MYKLTRQEAAAKLWISTRSIDRYIKSGKVRSKKDGKVVYVKSSDLDNLLSWWTVKQEIIYSKGHSWEKGVWEKNIVKHNSGESWTLEKIYEDLRKEIHKKDDLIQTLSIRVWKSEEIAKNSVSLMEFKKSQFLLEESKGGLYKELENIEGEKKRLEQELKYEKTSNVILIIFVILLFIVAGTVWFVKI